MSPIKTIAPLNVEVIIDSIASVLFSHIILSSVLDKVSNVTIIIDDFYFFV